MWVICSAHSRKLIKFLAKFHGRVPVNRRESLPWNKQHHLSASATVEHSCRSTSIAKPILVPQWFQLKIRGRGRLFLLTSQGNKNQENSHLANTERATNLQQPNFLRCCAINYFRNVCQIEHSPQINEALLKITA